MDVLVSTARIWEQEKEPYLCALFVCPEKYKNKLPRSSDTLADTSCDRTTEFWKTSTERVGRAGGGQLTAPAGSSPGDTPAHAATPGMPSYKGSADVTETDTFAREKPELM